MFDVDMRKVIEMGIKNGFKRTEHFLLLEALYNKSGFKKDMAVYKLIFGTDFIECLVGEGRKEYICDPDGGFLGYCTFDSDVRNKNLIKPKCPYYNKSNVRCKYYRFNLKLDADYHREVMSNLKDVEELIKYINDLVEGSHANT